MLFVPSPDLSEGERAGNSGKAGHDKECGTKTAAAGVKSRVCTAILIPLRNNCGYIQDHAVDDECDCQNIYAGDQRRKLFFQKNCNRKHDTQSGLCLAHSKRTRFFASTTAIFLILQLFPVDTDEIPSAA